MANKKWKLSNSDYWATDGIYDFGQNKTQRQINSDLNTALNDVTDDVSEIGTEAYSSQTVTLSSQNFETVGSITLTAGYWIITAYINASEAFDEAFYCRLLKNGATLARENLDGRGGGGISLSALCDVLNGTVTISLYAYQGSNSNKTVTYRLYAIRIKGV